jgi:hypothetical protein
LKKLHSNMEGKSTILKRKRMAIHTYQGHGRNGGRYHLVSCAPLFLTISSSVHHAWSIHVAQFGFALQYVNPVSQSLMQCLVLKVKLSFQV